MAVSITVGEHLSAHYNRQEQRPCCMILLMCVRQSTLIAFEESLGLDMFTAPASCTGILSDTQGSEFFTHNISDDVWHWNSTSNLYFYFLTPIEVAKIILNHQYAAMWYFLVLSTDPLEQTSLCFYQEQRFSTTEECDWHLIGGLPTSHDSDNIFCPLLAKINTLLSRWN